MTKLLALLMAVISLAGCNLPRDPESTLEDVRGGTMRVGITESTPWTELQADLPTGGVEVRLVQAFAAELGSQIEWIAGSEEDLFGALEVGELDLVIGGFTNDNPWNGKVTFTHPYITTFATVGVKSQQEIDIAGLEVAVESGTESAGLLRKTDAAVSVVDDIATAQGAAAVDNWLLDDLDLFDSGVRLKESDHVMAVPLGENAWLTQLERFLLGRPDEIEELLEEEGKP